MHHSRVRSFPDLRRISTGFLRSSLQFLGLLPCKGAGELVNFQFSRESPRQQSTVLFARRRLSKLTGGTLALELAINVPIALKIASSGQ
jgi:hypothetical protein